MFALPDRVYAVLKWVGLILVPVAAFTGTMGETWGWPHASQAVATITAIGTLIGAVVAVSSKSYYSNQEAEVETAAQHAAEG
ncbi:MAG: phage holin [Propionibacteriaceae bacterium]|jgi:hypothetical protein|nr:phage holin [Propionibacteriaceae bacterium]